MQRLKNGIVMDIRSQRLSRSKSLSNDYEMMELDFIEIRKRELHIIMPSDDPELMDYLSDGYKVLSRFRKNIAVPKKKVLL